MPRLLEKRGEAAWYVVNDRGWYLGKIERHQSWPYDYAASSVEGLAYEPGSASGFALRYVGKAETRLECMEIIVNWRKENHHAW